MPAVLQEIPARLLRAPHFFFQIIFRLYGAKSGCVNSPRCMRRSREMQ